ncbi:MAG: pitrilysin family protein [Planctomycetota bacterium]
MYQGTEEVLHNETLRETVYKRTHETGLPVYFCHKPGFQKRYACFATHYGSVDTAFSAPGLGRQQVADGVAHFLEHKVFEREDGNALELFSKRGAACNAYTSYAVTNYLFSCGDGFFDHLGALVDFVLTPYITDENVEKEKGIIGQEIRMYEDHAGWRIFTNLMAGLYQNHPVRNDIAGTVESIAELNTESLYACHRSFYHPGNMIAFGIGDEDRERFFETMDASLARHPEWAAVEGVEKHYPDEPASIADANRVLEMEVSMPQLLVGIKDRSAGKTGRAFLKQELVTDILLEIVFGKASAIYQQLYADKLIDESFSTHYSAYGNIGFSVIGGDTEDPEKLANAVRGEIEAARDRGVSAEDFERQKRASMGSFFRMFNSLDFTANNFCTYRFYGVDLFDIIDVLHSIEISDLTDRLSEHFCVDAVSTSAVIPKGQ